MEYSFPLPEILSGTAPLPYRKCDAPTGKSGDWELSRFEQSAITTADIAGEEIPEWALRRAGTFSRLSLSGEVYMTDLYEEWWSQREAIREGLTRGGEILVSGLGLGLVVSSLLDPPDSQVTRITVLEKSADVVGLVSPHLGARYGERLRVIHTSAFDWVPDTRFTVAWHDIWPNPDADYSEEIKSLHARYDAHSNWQKSWTRETYAAEPEHAAAS